MWQGATFSCYPPYSSANQDYKSTTSLPPQRLTMLILHKQLHFQVQPSAYTQLQDPWSQASAIWQDKPGSLSWWTMASLALSDLTGTLITSFWSVPTRFVRRARQCRAVLLLGGVQRLASSKTVCWRQGHNLIFSSMPRLSPHVT